MEWNKFTPLQKKTPQEIIEDAIMGFDKATNDLAHLLLIKKNDLSKVNSRLNNNFEFELLLYSKYLDGYNFKVFEFGFNIDLYPVSVIIEPAIFDQLNYYSASRSSVSFETEELFLDCITKIFSSERFKTITGGVMKIAAKQLENDMI